MIEVDIAGLAKLLERKGVQWVVLELIQNAWDTATESVEITLKPIPNKSQVRLVVTDTDPEGFVELSHAWTLFAESLKKDDPRKRGRFNMGEKLVLAYCVSSGGSVWISTTKGTVIFDKEGRRRKRAGTEVGSSITCVMKMTRDQMEMAKESVMQLIAPIPTMFNGEMLPERTPLSVVEMSLKTEMADEDGVLRRVTRKTQVGVYAPADGESSMIYEMGIPVVETGDKWHYDVQQKVPLNMERDNVSPAYLRTIRAFVLNAMHSRLSRDEATEQWVNEASSDKRCTGEATDAVMTKRFGKKRVSYDPSDPEANKLAMSKGYTVIPGRALSKGQWSNLKRSGGVKPAGQVTPSPKPFVEEGEDLVVVPEAEWDESMASFSEYVKAAARATIQRGVRVTYADDPGWHFDAAYGSGGLIVNLRRWARDIRQRGDEASCIRLDALLIHELAHEESTDHFSHDFLDATCRIGARLAAWKQG